MNEKAGLEIKKLLVIPTKEKDNADDALEGLARTIALKECHCAKGKNLGSALAKEDT
ncbi:hypothetical protein HAX54_001191, partial [Datura stramonium]|nr:hypothetical protein [Datura stramonium]